MEATNKLERFEIAHGGREVMLRVNGWFLFPDGAMREANPEGALCNPPTDPFLRQQKVVLWHETYVARVVKEFDELRQKLQNRAKNAIRDSTPPPSKSDMTELKRLQFVAQQRQRALIKARKQLEAVTPSHYLTARIMTAENQEAAATVLKELQDIQL